MHSWKIKKDLMIQTPSQAIMYNSHPDKGTNYIIAYLN
jgi:hypothetical protein